MLVTFRPHGRATCTLHKYNIMYLIIIAPLSMYKGRRSRSFEEDFPHHNWFIVVLVLPFVFNVGYVILTPSIYQFVTTPRSLPEELENGEVCLSKLYTHQAYNYTHSAAHSFAFKLYSRKET